MKQTVVGAFDQYSAAQRAADYLASQGIERDHIHVQATEDADSGYRPSASTTAAASDTSHESRGVMASVRSFFSEVFGPDREHEDLHQYAETIKRGGAVVAVDVDEESQVTEVCRKLKNAGAIDLDQRVSEWRSAGWSGYDEGMSSGYAADRTTTTTGTTAMDTMAAGTTAMGTAGMAATGSTALGSGTAGMRTETEGRVMQENVVPVVQEDIEIGKRMVEQGGIRVYSHVVEQPVRESVNLRSEKAVVERRPVDRPLSDADAAAFQDRTIEVRETAEKAVVSKTAHVVEEVVVGKEVQHQTQEVTDTVRRTEVEVQRLDGDNLQRSDAGYDTHALAYRDHFDRNYSNMGAVYDEYEPAYRYGHTLASDERYRGRDWDTMEPEVRRDWESRYGSSSGSTWENMKASVRHAWERAKS